MPVYDFKCAAGHEHQFTLLLKDRAKPLSSPCPISGCGAKMTRRFGFALKPIMHEHFNHTVGRTISSERQFASELRRASDEATARTGIPHDFQPKPLQDIARETATEDGMKATHDRAVAEGRPPPKLP